MTAWPSLPAMDLVFLRNVLIYFDQETKASILQRMRGVLRPHGYLLLGASETTLNIDEGFERHPLGRTVWYTKRPSATSST
jgi:chemotaxis protein methyltransferase CheR